MSEQAADRGVLKKLINDPFDAVDEMVEGFAAAHADVVRVAGERVIARRSPAAPKVGLVIGGGSGHEPAFLGYVGGCLADHGFGVARGWQCGTATLRILPTDPHPPQ